MPRTALLFTINISLHHISRHVAPPPQGSQSHRARNGPRPDAAPSAMLRDAVRNSVRSSAESGQTPCGVRKSTFRKVREYFPQSTPAGSAARIPPSGRFGRGHARWRPGINRRRAWQEGTVGTSPSDAFGMRGDIAWGAFIGREAFLVLYNSTLPPTKACLCPAPSPGFTGRACTCRWPTGRADG